MKNPHETAEGKLTTLELTHEEVVLLTMLLYFQYQQWTGNLRGALETVVAISDLAGHMGKQQAEDLLEKLAAAHNKICDGKMGFDTEYVDPETGDVVAFPPRGSMVQ